MPQPLIVYKASAGSGKTLTLAAEYIKLVIANPQAYKQILAVTFTNKATEEMKLRILSQLYGIWRQHDASAIYRDIVCRELQASPEWVSQQAGTALHYLLHNYSYFRVETIDSFFQSVLRNLARELELTANLRVGLNDNQVEEQAVDQLIESLSAQDELLQWILQYIMDSIEEDRSWNVVGHIKKFGTTIFRDYYKSESGPLQTAIAQKGFFDHYKETLRQLQGQASEKMKSVGESFLDELDAEGLTVDDLAYGSQGVAGLFLKLSNNRFDPSVVTKRVADCLGQPEKWCKKSHPHKELIWQLADGVLGDILRYALEEQPRQWSLFQSARLTLRHLSQLRLLGSIEEKVREINQENNRFLLSDTQQLLNDLIEGSDTPFIFEKIGAQLEHIMIDEFQDTSTVQWKNFKILLNEVMSHENTENLIVGDVKQSIYRWRNGDWRLLHGIRNEFGHPDENLSIRELSTNYRSARNIVTFNNEFFSKAAQIEEVEGYEDVRQQVPERKGTEGKVSVTLLPAADYQEAMLESIVLKVKELMDSQVPITDIAILVRTNGYISLIANFFMQHLPDVAIVSDEAFRLDASLAVQTIVAALQYIIHPDDAITRAFLVKAFSGNMDGQLPDELLSDNLQQLKSRPLYELTEQLYSIFRLDRLQGQATYLCTFYDLTAAFLNDQPADIAHFLKYWDEELCSKTIQLPSVNGIRIISIHKSKGLEFANVILPFCDWKIQHSDVLWCRPKVAPFNQLPLAPVDFSQSGMMGTIYEEDYLEEHQQTVIDNLNLLYVAFTRASANLFVYGRRNSKGTRSALIESVLPEIVGLLPEATLTGEQDAEGAIQFDFGHLLVKKARIHENRAEQNVFLQPEKEIEFSMTVGQPKVEYRQSNDSRKFVQSNDDTEATKQNSYIEMGLVLHQLFSTIRTLDDLDQALLKMEADGILYDRSITKEKLEEMIRKRLTNSKVREWFSGKYRLYNECTILSTDPTTGKSYERRPDRVMTNGTKWVVVDFKFGRERNEYHQQVREYMDLLRQMGHQQVEGYLWLVYSNQIIPVLTPIS